MDRWAQTEEAESIGGEEEVWIMEMMAVVGRKTSWSGQAEAGVEEEEVWIVASPVGPQLDQAGWLKVFS